MMIIGNSIYVFTLIERKVKTECLTVLDARIFNPMVSSDYEK